MQENNELVNLEQEVEVNIPDNFVINLNVKNGTLFPNSIYEIVKEDEVEIDWTDKNKGVLIFKATKENKEEIFGKVSKVAELLKDYII